MKQVEQRGLKANPHTLTRLVRRLFDIALLLARLQPAPEGGGDYGLRLAVDLPILDAIIADQVSQTALGPAEYLQRVTAICKYIQSRAEAASPSLMTLCVGINNYVRSVAGMLPLFEESHAPGTLDNSLFDAAAFDSVGEEELVPRIRSNYQIVAGIAFGRKGRKAELDADGIKRVVMILKADLLSIDGCLSAAPSVGET